MRRGAGAIALGLVVVALAGCGGSNGISLPCSPQPQGRLCLKVLRKGHAYVPRLIVGDAIGYLAASGSPLAGRTWRLVLTSHPCEPTICSVAGTYPGRARHGDPPRATSCRTASGSTTSTPAGCHDTLASAYASLGDFAGFHVPAKVGPTAWLCVAEQIRSGRAWRTVAKPPRACLSVASQ